MLPLPKVEAPGEELAADLHPEKLKHLEETGILSYCTPYGTPAFHLSNINSELPVTC